MNPITGSDAKVNQNEPTPIRQARKGRYIPGTGTGKLLDKTNSAASVLGTLGEKNSNTNFKEKQFSNLTPENPVEEGVVAHEETRSDEENLGSGVIDKPQSEVGKNASKVDLVKSNIDPSKEKNARPKLLEALPLLNTHKFLPQNQIQTPVALTTDDAVIVNTPSKQTQPDPVDKASDKVSSSDIGNLKQSSKKEVEVALNHLNQLNQKNKPDQYGVTTYDFKAEGQNYQVNVFNEGAYNDVKTEDYIKRIELIEDAAIRHIKNQRADTPKREEYIKKLKDLVNIYKDNIRKQCGIDPKMIAKEDAGDPAAQGYFSEIYQKAKSIISELEFVITNLEGMPACKDGKMFDVKALEQSEIECVIERGRPIIINIFTLEGKQFVSMQTPMSETVLPSTARNREGLANYVRTSFGILHEGNDMEVLFSGIRHGIYPPYLIDDAVVRQSMATNNVKQNLEEIAKGMLHDNHEDYKQDNPLVIPLRVMSLVTVKKGDFLRNESPIRAIVPDAFKKLAGGWKGESETTQLLETVQSLRTMNDQVYKMTINGKDVWVKPSISIMNLGCNIGATEEGLMGMIPERVFLNKLNARGFNAMVADIGNICKEYLSLVDDDSNDSAISKQIKGTLNDISSIFHENAKLNELKVHYGDELKVLYKKLNDLQQEYKNKVDGKDKKDIELIKKNMKQCKADIDIIEDKFDKINLEIIEEKRLQYFQNKDDLKNKLQELEKINISNLSDKTKEAIQHLKDLLELYSGAEKIFFEEKFRQSEHVMDFQVLYNLMQEKMNTIIEFFCKSAEDRTGRLDDKMQETMIYRNVNGKYPDFSNEEDKKTLDRYAKLVHQYSASQNNTEQNSNARGEQIGDQVNPGIHAKRGKMQAGLAKGIHKEAVNIKAPVLVNIDEINKSFTDVK